MNSSPKQEKTSLGFEAKKRLDQARGLIRRNEELRRELEMNMHKLDELLEESHQQGRIDQDEKLTN